MSFSTVCICFLIEERKMILSQNIPLNPMVKILLEVSLVIEHIHLILIAGVLVMKIQPKCHVTEPNIEAVDLLSTCYCF